MKSESSGDQQKEKDQTPQKEGSKKERLQKKPLKKGVSQRAKH
ncbi:hypothetical protein N409_01195 [Helicobacter pylori FD719]|nr:hypothetical protein N409_01195 [Helicobacter pylori FD719]